MDNLDFNMKYSPTTGDDAGRFLESMDAISSKFVGHLLTDADTVQQLEERYRNDEPQGLDQYRYPTARFMIPTVHEMIRKSGHVDALRQVTLAALAADYYRFQNKRLPGNLSEAMDGFLDDQPVDVYTGDPIIVRPQRSELLIFSCGPNGSDNGLEHDDIGIRLIQDKWSPLIGPVTEFD